MADSTAAAATDAAATTTTDTTATQGAATQAASGVSATAADKGAASAGDKTLAATGGDDAGAAAAAAAATAATAAAAGKPAAFPENWREQLAGDDKKALADLAKYTDPNALYKSLRDVQAKISKGELSPRVPLAADATPEQKAEWRKTNGLPDKPEGYVEKLALPEGMVIGEADKPLVADFAKAMFEAGASQDEMNRSVSWFYRMQDQTAAQRAEADGELKIASEVALRTEWQGADFKVNMNAFGAVSALMPEELRNVMFSARTPDGRLLGNTVEFLKWGAQLGRELNPAASVVPAGSGDAVKTIATEIATIEGQMYLNGEANPAYWKGESGAKMQARYRELIDARDKMASRRAA